MKALSTVELCSEQGTRVFAAWCATHLRFGEQIVLSGGLGAGKTTFVRYLVGALGSSVSVSSPSYVLSHEYAVPGGRLIEHWDLYRVAELPEEFDLEPQPQVLRIVEWGEKFPEIVERSYAKITLEVDTIDIERRSVIVEIDGSSSNWELPTRFE